jgi:predicted DNA-binding protein (MmcQ/YjbR family)
MPKIWTLSSLKNYCVSKPWVKETYPFDQATLVFKVMDKMFALCNVNDQPLEVNLKCEPELSELLQQKYASIKPGYHMNKRHWITLSLDGTVPEPEVLFLIDLSYELVVKKLSKTLQHRVLSAMNP